LKEQMLRLLEIVKVRFVEHGAWQLKWQLYMKLRCAAKDAPKSRRSRKTRATAL
jgi:hypothetical protein